MSGSFLRRFTLQLAAAEYANDISNSDLNVTEAPSPVEDEEASDDNILLLTLPRISAVVSFLAVLCVGMEAWKDWKVDQRHQRALSTNTLSTATRSNRKVPSVTYIQLFFQVPLLLQSLALALGPNLAPLGQVWGAAGNTQTCSFQGFLVQFSMMGSVGWDVALSTCFLLMVRRNVHSTRLQTWHIYLHLVIWPFALTMSLYPLVQGMYNFNTTVCWIETYPNECQGEDCIRGEGADLWQNITSLVAVVHFLYSISVVVTLYCTIRGWETSSQNTNQSKRDPQQSRTRNYSRAIGIQGMLYASGIIITVLPSVTMILLWNVAGLWSEGFSIFATTTTPLMGYVNFCVFMRGRRISECHTRYARWLRWMHSWMFDRRCCFKCACQCEWTGPHFNKRRDSMPMDHTASTTHRDRHDFIHRKQTWTRDTTGNVDSWDGHLPINVRLPPVVEEEDESERNLETNTARRKWLGYLIGWGEERDKELMSELGESSFNQDHNNYDFAPSQPKRTRSSAFGPPAPPRRAISQDSDGDSEGSNEDNYDKHTSPPVKPKREQSYMSEITLESALESFNAAKLSSVRPESYVSEMTLEEIEDWHYSAHSSATPPTKPERCDSQFEDTSDDGSRDSIHNVSGENLNRPAKELPSLSSQTKAAMRIVERAILEGDGDEDAAIKNTNTCEPSVHEAAAEGSDPGDALDFVELSAEARAWEATPIRPVRHVSEVEDTMSDDECGISEAPGTHTNTKLGAETKAGVSAPIRPVRYVSELEDDITKEKLVAAPPTRPVRHVSKVEDTPSRSPVTVDPSLSGNSSLKH